ncbi:DegT/DnrJ/EryC1/StrS family aminotransferase [Clostridium sp. AF19-22AC]|jgi:dTDP-4-amino-4,6-dideoxygalactose transaminase|uniref:DegT/DnrJ/EryC1/StrS family aminotransferase n=1 Tax=Clostridia TaxID=186801 RepID=UPI000E4E5C0A|nr:MULTISPECIES: DegT/DnrJ/EryC1/StrS family aminotransferase [Clostridia]RHR28736.1 DegT/DnrJ/EryC1/StrS family aminotransferase [Clostridium sp. AF19-22AC]
MDKQILVTQSSMPSLEEYIEEIKGIWDSHWLTNMGPKHQQLMGLLKDYLDVPNIDMFTNGHMAIELSIQALKFPLGSEIITTPFTFASTTHAIVRNGLEPVFCDINPVDFTINVDKIEDLITDRTVAIMPVHVYGNICNIEKIQKIANKYSLKVIYDAAHTFGIKYKGKGIGSYGDVSCFSFHATKVFNSIEGGAACFKDKEFGLELYRLKNFGIRGPEVVDGVGANAKMNEFCAAMGICNLRHLEEEIEKRKIVVARYRTYLYDIEGIQLNPIQENVETNYAYFPIIIDEKKFGATRNEVFSVLAENGICARKYFSPLTNFFDCFHGKYAPDKTPVALHISKRVLTLPLYADLELENVDRICEIILSCKVE